MDNQLITITDIETNISYGFMLASSYTDEAVFTIEGLDALSNKISSSEALLGDLSTNKVFFQRNWSGDVDSKGNNIGPSGIKYWTPAVSYSYILPTKCYWSSVNINSDTEGELKISIGIDLLDNFPSPEDPISCSVYVYPYLYVGLKNKSIIYRTNDNGATWEVFFNAYNDDTRFAEFSVGVENLRSSVLRNSKILTFIIKSPSGLKRPMFSFIDSVLFVDHVKERFNVWQPANNIISKPSQENSLILTKPKVGKYRYLKSTFRNVNGNTLEWKGGDSVSYYKPDNTILLYNSSGEIYGYTIKDIIGDDITIYGTLSSSFGNTVVGIHPYIIKVDSFDDMAIFKRFMFGKLLTCTNIDTSRSIVTFSGDDSNIKYRDGNILYYYNTNNTAINGTLTYMYLNTSVQNMSQPNVLTVQSGGNATINDFNVNEYVYIHRWGIAFETRIVNIDIQNNRIILSNNPIPVLHNEFNLRLIKKNTFIVDNTSKFLLQNNYFISNRIDYKFEVLGGAKNEKLVCNQSSDVPRYTPDDGYYMEDLYSDIITYIASATRTQGFAYRVENTWYRCVYSYNGNNEIYSSNSPFTYDGYSKVPIDISTLTSRPYLFSNGGGFPNNSITLYRMHGPATDITNTTVFIPEKTFSIQRDDLYSHDVHVHNNNGYILHDNRIIVVPNIHKFNNTTYYSSNFLDNYRYIDIRAPYWENIHNFFPTQHTQGVIPHKFINKINNNILYFSTNPINENVASPKIFYFNLSNNTFTFVGDINEKKIVDLIYDSAFNIFVSTNNKGKIYKITQNNNSFVINNPFSLPLRSNQKTELSNFVHFDGDIFVVNSANATIYRIVPSTNNILSITTITEDTDQYETNCLFASNKLFVDTNIFNNTYVVDFDRLSTYGSLTSSIYDGYLPGSNKLWLYAIVQTSPLLQGDTIRLQVSFDNFKTFYYLPTKIGKQFAQNITFPNGDYESNKVGETQHKFYFPFNTKSYKIAYRVILTRQSEFGPVVTSVGIYYKIIEPKEFVFKYLLSLYNYNEILDRRIEANKHNDKLKFLLDIWKNDKIVKIKHIDNKEYYCVPYKPDNYTGGGIKIQYNDFIEKNKNVNNINYLIEIIFKTIEQYNE